MTDVKHIWEEQALAWLVAIESDDFDRWQQFADWLALDQRHNEAYQRLLLADRQYQSLVATTAPLSEISASPPFPANEYVPVEKHFLSRRQWLGGAVAASAVAAVGVTMWRHQPNYYEIETQPGERQVITLADGSEIAINGGSRVELDKNQPRFARLYQGEALFTVVHKDDDPFVVESGNARLVDAGTAFNVIRTAESLDIAVSEGLVIYNPDRENVSLPAGRRLYRDDRKSRLRLSDIQPQQIGAWQVGQLNFTDAALGEVAAALARNLGENISTAPQITRRRFTGVIQLSPTGTNDIGAIAQILGVDARRSPDGWVLAANDVDR